MEPQKTPTGQPSDTAAPNAGPQGAPPANQESPSFLAGQTIKPQGVTPSEAASESEGSKPSSFNASMSSSVDADSSAAPADAPLPAPDTPVAPLPMAPQKHGKKGLILGLVLAAILLLLSGGAAAAYFYTVNKPENVLKQALANSFDLEKSKTVKFSAEATIEDKQSGTPFKMSLKGKADNKTGAFDFSGEADLLVTKLTYDLRSVDGKSYYVRAGGLDGLSELLASSGTVASAYAPVIATINDQWIEINESLIKQYDKSYKSAVLTEADARKVAEAYDKHAFLVVKEKLANETVAGQASHHYKVAIDEAKLKEFFVALKDANLDSYKVDQQFIDELNKALNEVDLSSYPVDVWISKKDKMFTRFAFKATIDQVAVDVSMTVENYNEPVEVEKPANAKSILELLSDVFVSGTDLTNMDFTLPEGDTSASGISL